MMTPPMPGTPPPSPPNPDEISVIQVKKDSGGKLEFHSQYPLGYGLSLRGEGFMAKPDPQFAHISLEVMKECK
jgi:hypothetical protein